MKRKSIAEAHCALKKRIKPEHYRLIVRAARDFEADCEQMWSDMIFDLQLRTTLSEKTIETLLEFMS